MHHCMIEHSGRCVKELETLRPFQTWSCLYKAWSYSRSREEPEEIRVREHRRVSEEETCAVYEPVPSTVTVPSPSSRRLTSLPSCSDLLFLAPSIYFDFVTTRYFEFVTLLRTRNELFFPLRQGNKQIPP